MYCEKLLDMTQVAVSDPKLFEEILRNEPKFPTRPCYPSWPRYRELRGYNRGLLTAEGDDWFRFRKAVGKRLLKPQLAASFDVVINEVVDDMIKHMRHMREKAGKDGVIMQLPFEMYKWSIESVSKVLFEKRLGCLQTEIPAMTQKFIDNVNTMLVTSERLFVLMELQEKYQTKWWRDHIRAWDGMFDVVRHLVDTRVAEIADKLENTTPDADEGMDFLTYLMATRSMDIKEIHSTMVDLMIGGVDTASNTICFACHLLANHPEEQRKLVQEVDSVLKGRVATAEDIPNLPVLKKVVKETFRLYPVVPINARMVTEEFVLEGYLIPKDSLLALGFYNVQRSDEYFERANDFIPDRWDRETAHDHHAFSVLPFGYGVRSCVGRRVALLELHLALIRIIQNFRLEPYDGFPLVPTCRGVLSPGQEVPVRFIDRGLGVTDLKDNHVTTQKAKQPMNLTAAAQ
ncbi:cytochrome P450 27C1 isoform X2 [Lingula anatina]|nr:cytochrome P450 27C1 isoform X2 [Lingula anatina]|eukprot:XP_013412288.1 cytochrome P450 27C1 isoform X2 [Lingula anatina]